jgi:hypothetical protein
VQAVTYAADEKVRIEILIYLSHGWQRSGFVFQPVVGKKEFFQIFSVKETGCLVGCVGAVVGEKEKIVVFAEVLNKGEMPGIIQTYKHRSFFSF